MITPSFSLTATERVLPKLALDFTTASLDARVTFTRTTDATHPATYTNSSGYITAATNNQPRFDYDPVSLVCKGLLIEESRTNLLKQSQNLNDATWIKTRASITSNATTSPDGTSNADKVIATAVNDTHQVRQSYTPSIAGQAYTVSFYAKAEEISTIYLLTDSAGWPIATTFNLATGTPSQGTMTSVGNGWYRCAVTAVVSGVVALNVVLRLTTSNFLGDNVKGAYIWGVQMEAAAFATSYIPTTTTALTRNADVATMTGTNFSDWWNASEGALLAIGSRFGTSNVFPRLVQFDDGTDNNAMNVAIYGSNNNAQANVTASGSAQTSFSTISGGANVTMGVALAYKTDNFGCSANASSPQIDTSGTVPTVNRAIFGARPSGPVYLNGYIKKVMYWPQRLTQNELQAFSK